MLLLLSSNDQFPGRTCNARSGPLAPLPAHLAPAVDRSVTYLGMNVGGFLITTMPSCLHCAVCLLPNFLPRAPTHRLASFLLLDAASLSHQESTPPMPPARLNRLLALFFLDLFFLHYLTCSSHLNQGASECTPSPALVHIQAILESIRSSILSVLVHPLHPQQPAPSITESPTSTKLHCHPHNLLSHMAGTPQTLCASGAAEVCAIDFSITAS